MFTPFTGNLEDLRFTVNQLDAVIPGDVIDTATEISDHGRKILRMYQDLQDISQLEEISGKIQRICRDLDQMAHIFSESNPDVAARILELRLSWDEQSPHTWYELGKIKYLNFISRKTDNLEEIIGIFKQVISLVEKLDKYHDMGFWSYSYMANMYLYRILSGEEALVQAMKNYNEAYRFSQEHTVAAHEDFIFNDLEILQNILMNQYPLLVLIYNESGVSLFEYLFQFVEVITQEQRFIPNFTALLSVVDERIRELFNSPISSAYLVLENRLMVMSSLYDKSNESWIKIAFIFSYLQQNSEDIEINQVILKKVSQLKNRLLEDEEIADHLLNFSGKHSLQVNIKIEEILNDVFAHPVS